MGSVVQDLGGPHLLPPAWGACAGPGRARGIGLGGAPHLLSPAEGLKKLFSGASMAASRGMFVTVGQVGLLLALGFGQPRWCHCGPPSAFPRAGGPPPGPDRPCTPTAVLLRSGQAAGPQHRVPGRQHLHSLCCQLHRGECWVRGGGGGPSPALGAEGTQDEARAQKAGGLGRVWGCPSGLCKWAPRPWGGRSSRMPCCRSQDSPWLVPGVPSGCIRGSGPGAVRGEGGCLRTLPGRPVGDKRPHLTPPHPGWMCHGPVSAPRRPEDPPDELQGRVQGEWGLQAPPPPEYRPGGPGGQRGGRESPCCHLTLHGWRSPVLAGG